MFLANSLKEKLRRNFIENDSTETIEQTKFPYQIKKKDPREKQLEEARKLATLQKKRELRAAGIEFHVSVAKRLLKETHYNRDVPFMREVPKGTWTDDNDNETPAPNKYKADINLQYLEGRSRDIQEEKQKKKDEAKLKSLKLKNLPKDHCKNLYYILYHH